MSVAFDLFLTVLSVCVLSLSIAVIRLLEAKHSAIDAHRLRQDAQHKAQWGPLPEK